MKAKISPKIQRKKAGSMMISPILMTLYLLVILIMSANEIGDTVTGLIQTTRL